MRETPDRALIRSILERDRPWAVYALGDLSPGFAEHCQWFVLQEAEPALLLLYRRFDPPILFALGPPSGLRQLVQEVNPRIVSLHVRTEALDAIGTRYRSTEIRPMWRMVVDSDGFRPVAFAGTRRVSGADVAAVERLYADGEERGESPDFFHPSMVEEGMFWGAWEGGDLVSVAGTHLAVPSEGVCAIGNVYTRHDRRGRGLAARVTSAVASAALTRGFRTVVLNVDERNAAAIRVYRRLGFRFYCGFAEGLALRSS
jgi:predicted GNAT family acetyltransferase